MTAGARRAGWAWLVWLVISGGVLVLAAALRYDPPQAILIPGVPFRLPPICATQRMFGIDCPGCGLTRSFVLAADGRWADAAAMHPVGMGLFVLLVLQLPWRVAQGWWALRHGRSLSSGRIELVIAAALGLAAFLWWLAKAAALAFL